LGGGSFTARPAPAEPSRDDAFDKKERRFSASHQGFDIHCAVRIDKDDDEGSQAPRAVLRAYRMKTPRRGSTHRVMTPMELMARPAVLVPPPFFPLTRYHGVFAARSSWRAPVTPKPRLRAANRRATRRATTTRAARP